MPNRASALTVLTALLLVLGIVPAFADDAGESESPDTEATAEVDEEGIRLDGKLLILLAEGFNANEDDLAALAGMGLGWGSIFKLNLYSTVLGVPIDELLAGAAPDDETGEIDFGWGELRQALTEDQLAVLESMPRTFGQLVSAEHRHQGRDEHRPEHAGRDGVRPDRGNRPDANPNSPDHAGKGGHSGK